jgi:hypothetical protein
MGGGVFAKRNMSDLYEMHSFVFVYMQSHLATAHKKKDQESCEASALLLDCAPIASHHLRSLPPSTSSSLYSFYFFFPLLLLFLLLLLLHLLLPSTSSLLILKKVARRPN